MTGSIASSPPAVLPVDVVARAERHAARVIDLNERAKNHRTIRMQSAALLTGRIFDDRGNRMSPTHARKGGVKYGIIYLWRCCRARSSWGEFRA